MSSMRSVTVLLAVLPATTAVGAAYTKVGDGPCRGNGGVTDKVNARHLKNVASEADCESYCDNVLPGEGLCAGFAYEAAGEKECICYGPGMSGSCADPNQAVMSPTACTAIGTCSSPTTATSEEECGTCSDPTAVKSSSCASVAATWSGASWTTTGVWEFSVSGGANWIGEFQYTDHVHSVDPNANYVCYDKDVTDHIGKCSNGADTPMGFDCAANFTAADTYGADSCPTDPDPAKCTWTPAPTSPVVKPAHPPVTAEPGYTFKSGACRGTSSIAAADTSIPDGQDRPNYMYKKNAAFPTFPTDTSPSELAAECTKLQKAHLADASQPGCLGFHSGPWMSLFGVGLNAVGAWQSALGGGWVGAAGQPETTTITTTKPNHQYVCFYYQGRPPPSPPMPPPAPSPPMPPPALSDTEEPCFPSASTVIRANGTPARLDELKEGDEIVAATDDGKVTTDTVSLLSIAKPEAVASFFSIGARGTNATLTITAGHHVPVGASCCSTLMLAKDVAVGETVWSFSGGAAVPSTVALKSITQGKGLHSPVLTRGGFPIIDGFVTAFDSIEKVTLAKYGLEQLLAACKATGTCSSLRGTFLHEEFEYVAPGSLL